MPQQVTNDVIAANAVTATSVATDAIITAKIQNDAVTTAKILNANVTPAKLSQPFTAGTVQATTSGTEKDFAIPAWAKRIRVLLNGVSLSGTLQPRIRVGAASTPATSGYNGAGSVSVTTTSAAATLSGGFDVYLNVAGATGDIYYGAMELSQVDATNNIWVASGVFSCSAGRTHVTAGSITLAGALNIVRVMSTGAGTDAFDAGSVNVLYD
jgi:hypothetical protein